MIVDGAYGVRVEYIFFTLDPTPVYCDCNDITYKIMKQQGWAWTPPPPGARSYKIWSRLGLGISILPAG